MFMPIGLEDARVHRVPWISLGIAAMCLVGFVATWSIPAAPMGDPEVVLGPVLEHWSRHPYLELPPALAHMLDVAALRTAAQAEAQGVQVPPAALLQSEQSELDRAADEALQVLDAAP